MTGLVNLLLPYAAVKVRYSTKIIIIFLNRPQFQTCRQNNLRLRFKLKVRMTEILGDRMYYEGIRSRKLQAKMNTDRYSSEDGSPMRQSGIFLLAEG